MCTQCASNTFRSDADPPGACKTCPATSRTFALGAASEAECMCEQDYFSVAQPGSAEFVCRPVPMGGWAPQGDNRLFAQAEFWRADANASKLFECAYGLCLKELPLPNGTQTGFRCREGHTGHLCAVCQEGWSSSGIYCERCAEGTRWGDWPRAKRAALLTLAVLLIAAAAFLLFLLPLFPRVEAALAALLRPAAARVEQMLDTITLARVSQSRVSQSRTPRASSDASAGRPATPVPRVVPQGSKLHALLEVVQEPLRITIGFWQIVSSFSQNLFVPWPAIYYNLASTLNVVSLKFLQIPALSCVQPAVGFYTARAERALASPGSADAPARTARCSTG